MLQRHLAADAARRASLVLSVRARLRKHTHVSTLFLCAVMRTQTHTSSSAPLSRHAHQVHDDVVLEVDAAALPAVAALVRAVLVRAGVDAGVTAPLAVRLRAGPDWHALTDVD